MAGQSVVVKSGKESTPLEREAFVALVSKGGEVQPALARAGIKRAERLAFAFIGEQLAGVACLKRPLNTYRNGVFEKAKSGIDPSGFILELGYISVEPEFQGRRLSAMLTGALLRRSSSKVFATSAVTNIRMHATLARFGFQRRGEAYASADDPKRLLYLFIRG